MSNYDVSTIYLSNSDKIALCYVRIMRKVKIKDIESHPHFSSIEKKALIRRIFIENGTRRPTSTDKFEISDIGRDYINFRREHRFDFVMTPIIVSILTNIAIYGLERLLSLIQR